MMSPKYFKISRFADFPQLFHGFGTRLLGEEDQIRDQAGKKFKWISIRQVHSDKIRVITTPPPKKPEGDALLTNRKGILLTVRTADCLPILLFDPEYNAVAAVHCGWRGTSERLVFKVVKALESRYGCSNALLLAALGPCIERECYEVGEDVIAVFKLRNLDAGCFLPHAVHPGKYYLDLKCANEKQLLDAGIKRKNIFSVDKCTFCEPGLFSYRREGVKTGRLINFIGFSF